MSNTESVSIPTQEPRSDVEVDYAPDVPLAVRLQRERARLARLAHAS